MKLKFKIDWEGDRENNFFRILKLLYFNCVYYIKLFKLIAFIIYRKQYGLLKKMPNKFFRILKSLYFNWGLCIKFLKLIVFIIYRKL